MTKALAIFLAVFLSGSLYAQRSSFFDELLNYQNCRHYYSLQIEIESKSYSGKALIENDDLIEFLRTREGLGIGEYKSVAFELLNGNRKLQIDNAKVQYDLILNPKEVEDVQIRLL